GRPDDAIGQLKGKVWQRSIAKTELADYEARHKIISSRLVGGRPFIHVLSEQALNGGFQPSTPDLEDVFFTKIRGWN
ncbi:MAG TPA: hypothetical protein VFI60_10320, partial [Candidatus Acidoferrum sp.]|nr:hypothetical protein [Candidatus Acidoferrum sp.]